MRVTLEFQWRCPFVGAVWSRVGREQHLYVCLLPFLPLHVSWPAKGPDPSDGGLLGCWPDAEDDHAWLCDCGHYQEDAFHCDLCGREPPWGCACCEDRDDGGDDEFDELLEDDGYGIP